MPAAKVIQAQRDFSAGEIDPEAKRNDENPLLKAGARQALNLRILNSRALRTRPGRRALFLEQGRVEEVQATPALKYFLVFGANLLRIYSASGVKVFESLGQPWNLATVGQITWAPLTLGTLSIYIAFAGVPPQVLSFDGVATWSIANYAESVTGGGQKRTIFYRIAPPGITMQPSATVGAITISFAGAGSSFLTAGYVNTRVRFCGRQILITGIIGPQQANATVQEGLPPAQQLAMAANPTGIFNIGDVVIGAVSGAKGIVLSVGAVFLGVQLISSTTTTTAAASGAQTLDPSGGRQPAGPTTTAGFVISEIVAGPGGSIAIGGAGSVTTIAPQAVAVWDQEVMNGLQGWPASVFADQGRLGFCNFPAVPRGVAWSAIDAPADLYVDAPPSAAIFDLIPDTVQALYVVPGMEGSEFVFTDKSIYYIQINSNNPLRPGSVAFNQISQHGCAPNIQPRRAEQSILYVKAGGTQIGAVQAPGAYYRPYTVDNISELRSHLFKTPVAIAIPPASTQFEENYLYVLNADGTLAVGKYTMKNGLLDVGPEGKPHVGWVPWSGAGAVQWVAALGSDALFTTSYPGATGAMVEVLDNDQYLDAAISVNAAPAALAPPGGQGPLWFWAGAAVTLMDQGTRAMGTYQVDATGNLVAQNVGGENLLAASLVAGQPWTATLEPFVPAVKDGADQLQRTRKRRIARLEIYVSSSSGFRLDTFYTEQQGANLKAPGTVTKTRRVETYNQGDDPTQPPRLFERAYTFRPRGRAHDPRVAVAKDTPGPLVIEEMAMEVTV